MSKTGKESRIKTVSESASSKRKLLGAIAAGGGVLSLKAAPANWRKPIVASVMLPAHAQGSACLGSIANCPDGSLFSTSDTNNIQSFQYGELTGISGITWDGSYLTGSGSTIFPSTFNNPIDCGECGGDPRKYASKYASFGSGEMEIDADIRGYCGDNLISSVEFNFSGKYSGTIGSERVYTGVGSNDITVCKYNFLTRG